MGDNYMKQRQKRDQYMLSVGEDLGFQKCLDYMHALLRNPKYVGRDVFGRKRWELLLEGLTECDKKYGNAFTFEVDADVCQEKLDAELREIYGDDALAFNERYPFIKEQRYDKAMKGWK